MFKTIQHLNNSVVFQESVGVVGGCVCVVSFVRLSSVAFVFLFFEKKKREKEDKQDK